MRQQKWQGPRGAVPRKGKTTAGMKIENKRRPMLIRPVGDDWDDDDEDDEGHGPRGVRVYEQNRRNPEFTGVLDAEGAPIFRFFMPKPGVGFLAEGIEDFEPEAFMYATSPELVLGDDEAEDGDEDGAA